LKREKSRRLADHRPFGCDGVSTSIKVETDSPSDGTQKLNREHFQVESRSSLETYKNSKIQIPPDLKGMLSLQSDYEKDHEAEHYYQPDQSG
jgi:hypothetical protein